MNGDEASVEAEDRNVRIIRVTAENLGDHPQAICFINPKHEFYNKKVEWLRNQFDLGLTIKLLYIESEKRPTGFIEYVPGQSCWRAVDAKGYIFIHCIWTSGKKFQHQGLGGRLIAEAEKDADGMAGAAVVTSDRSFMADRALFEKHGYRVVEESGKEQLMVKPFKKSIFPKIKDWESKLKTYEGLWFIYSRQCPWVARFIEEVKPILEEEGIKPNIVELKTPGEAQDGPSLYGVFNCIYNGKLLADRYISTTRFKNIAKKEILP